VIRTNATRERFSGSTLCAALMGVAAVTFWVASIIHFGATFSIGSTRVHDPFPGAAIPEAIVGIVVASGALGLVARWRSGWRLAVSTTAFAIVVTLYGLSVTLGGGRSADVAYHVSVLTLLFAVLGMLVAGHRGRHRTL
jgi:hypothetical protein